MVYIIPLIKILEEVNFSIVTESSSVVAWVWRMVKDSRICHYKLCLFDIRIILSWLFLMQDGVNPPTLSVHLSPTPTKKGSLAPHRKEFKSEPKLKTKESATMHKLHFFNVVFFSWFKLFCPDNGITTHLLFPCSLPFTSICLLL